MTTEEEIKMEHNVSHTRQGKRKSRGEFMGLKNGSGVANKEGRVVGGKSLKR